MSKVRLPNPAGKPIFCGKIGSWFLVIPSAIVGVLLVELFCRLFLPSPANTSGIYQWPSLAMFFDGPDTIFKNREDIFTYIPHGEFRNLTASFPGDSFTVEYDYRFRTNNFGLVEDADIIPERGSLLLLGDSFAEGQGAEPWFRLVSPEIDKLGYQSINGGLRGTGFQQWFKLDRYLAAQNVPIQKIVVMFISDDFRRPLTNIKPSELQCLAALPLCHLEESYYFRLPPREELSALIAKIRAARAPMERSWLGARAAMLLPVSYHLYRSFKERIKKSTSDPRLEAAEQQSRAAVAGLIAMYGADNVTFIHIPQKDELDEPNELGLRARRAIRDAGGRLFDGFKLCHLTATDYYANDNHPNRGGYAKIASCVTSVIKEAVAGVQ
jgi:hypothetical protein